MHDHEHHSHEPKNFNKAFAIGIGLNIAFVLLETVFGLTTHSLALLSDAGHNLSDVLSLALAWGATRLSQTPPTPRHTYGLRSSSILAALFNALILLAAIGAIVWEAIRRFANPEPIAGGTVMLVAGVGVVINGITALLFMSGRSGDLNIRGAFLHMAADAGISLGVVFAGWIMQQTGALWIDPAISLAIAIMILVGTWGLLRDSIHLALAAVPEGIDTAVVANYLKALPKVVQVHDLHIWALSTTEVALTVHLVMQPAEVDNHFLQTTAQELREKFKIHHPTFQLESDSPSNPCPFAPARVI